MQVDLEVDLEQAELVAPVDSGLAVLEVLAEVVLAEEVLAVVLVVVMEEDSMVDTDTVVTTT